MRLRGPESIVGHAPSRTTGVETYVIHRPAGTYPAGSLCVELGEAWLVGCMLQDERHTRAYRSLDEAAREWHKITGEIEL